MKLIERVRRGWSVLGARPELRWAMVVLEVVWLLGLCWVIAQLWEIPVLSFPYWRF